MKKLFVLTSVLALAACGGGSGGGGMSDFDRAALSNANITGMVSRIQDGDTYSNFARTATVGRASSSRDTSSNIFLDDVLFESADKEYDTVNPNEDFMMRFIVDHNNGKIVGIETIDDGETGNIDRVGDTNEFAFESDTAYVQLFGYNKGLKYADFGFIDVHGIYRDENGDENITRFIMPIAGGYESKNITADMNPDNFSQNVVFNGIAVADVGEPDTTVAGDRLTLRDNNATLTFKQDSGNEVLTASFRDWTDTTSGAHYDGWYDIVATRYNSGEDAGKAEIAFSTPEGRVIPTGFEAVGSGKVQNNTHENQLSVGFNYYGDTVDAPHEATGIIHYQCPGCQPFLMGFGGKAE